MEDNLKSIYDYLSSKGGQGSYEEFVDFFNANDDNKHTIYDYMAKEGGQGSYEEFLAFAGTPQRVDVSDVEEANQPNVVTLSEEELTPANVGNYTSRSGVSELKSPKELEASAQLNANKPLYSEWVKGVDADRLNDNYDLEKAYNLLPYEQMETWRTDTTGETHLPSVADNLKTGTVDFLKRKDHPSLQEELDWYNSDEESAKRFREEGWTLDDSGDYYKYVKKDSEDVSAFVDEGDGIVRYQVPKKLSSQGYAQVTEDLTKLQKEFQDASAEWNKMVSHASGWQKLGGSSEYNKKKDAIEYRMHALDEDIDKALQYQNEWLRSPQGQKYLDMYEAYCDKVDAVIKEAGGDEYTALGRFFENMAASSPTNMRPLSPQEIERAEKWATEGDILVKAKRDVKNARRQLRMTKERLDGTYKGFRRGWRATDVEGLSLLNDFTDKMTQMMLAKKVREGANLSPAEQALLAANELKAYTDMEFAGSNTMGERIGMSTAEQLVTTLQFYVGSELTGAMKIAKGITTGAMEGGTKIAARTLFGETSNLLRTAGAYSKGFAVGAAIQTFENPLSYLNMMADYAEKRTGTIYYDEKDDKIHYFDDEKSIALSLWQAAAGAYLDNSTEFAGFGLDKLGKLGLGKLYKAVPELEKAVGSVTNFLEKIKLSKISGFKIDAMDDFLQNAGFAGTLGEWGEEVLGNVVRPFMYIDTERGESYIDQLGRGLKNLIDKDQNIETFLSCAVTGVFMGSVSTLRGAAAKGMSNKDTRQFVRDNMAKLDAMMGGVTNLNKEEFKEYVADHSIADISQYIKDKAQANNWSSDEIGIVSRYVIGVAEQQAIAEQGSEQIKQAVKEAEEQARQLVNKWDGDHIYNVTVKDPNTGELMNGTIVNGRVHYSTNEDGSYKFNPYYSSGMLAIRLADGSVKQMSGLSVQSLDNVMTFEEQVSSQGQNIIGLMQQQFEQDGVLPTMESAWGFEFKPGATEVDGYTFVGKDKNGDYVFVDYRNAKVTMAEEDVIAWGLRREIELTKNENANNEMLDNISSKLQQMDADADLMSQIGDLKRYARSVPTTGMWYIVKKMTSEFVTLDENGLYDTNETTPNDAAVNLYAKNEGNYQEAKQAVAAAIASLNARAQQGVAQAVQSPTGSAVGNTEIKNAVVADTKKIADQIAFLNEVDKVLDKMQANVNELRNTDMAETKEELKDTMVSDMKPGTQFPIVYDNQKAVGVVSEKDGNKIVSILGEDGNVIVEDASDIDDEQWEALRRMAVEMENAPQEVVEEAPKEEKLAEKPIEQPAETTTETVAEVKAETPEMPAQPETKVEMTIPRDKNGNIDHAQLSKENAETYEAAVEEELGNVTKFAELGDADYLNRNLKEAQKKATEAANKKPKATGAAQLAKEIEKINATKQATQKAVDFWNDVKGRLEDAAIEQQTRLNEADKALVGLDENMKLYSEAPQEDAVDKEPANKHEFASTFLGSFQKSKNRLNKESLKTETGWSDADVKKLNGILSAEGGMSVDEMAESIFADAQQQYPGFFTDFNDAKTTLLEVLQEADNAGSIDTYIKDRRRGGSEVQARMDYEARQFGYEDAADMREKRVADARQKLESLKDKNGFVTEEGLKEFRDYVEGLKIKEAPKTESTETKSLNEQVEEAGLVNPNESEVDRISDELGRKEMEWEDKIKDYVFEHYPTQANVSAETNSEQGIKEREAMKQDATLQEMERQRKAELDEIDNRLTEAWKKEQEGNDVPFSVEADNSYQSRFDEIDAKIANARRSGQLTRAKLLQNQKAELIQGYLDTIKTDDVSILTSDNYEEKLKADGWTDDQIGQVRDKLAQVRAVGQAMGGFYLKGKIYIFADDIYSIDHARRTYIHERQHDITRKDVSLRDEIARSVPREELEQYVRDLSGSRTYDGSSSTTLADEFISMAMAEAYSTDDVESVLGAKGVNNKELIEKIKTLDNEQRESDSLAKARRGAGANLHVDNNGQRSGRLDGRHQEGRPREVGEQGLRPSFGGTQKTGIGEEVSSANEAEESAIKYSIVSDPKLKDELEKGEKIKVYRAMQMVDGKLYPPMAAKVNGKWQNPIELGVWEQADEHPELLDKNGKFKLDKGNGSSPMPVAYNPYIHTSYSPLNDQFTSASKRPNLVTVEVEIPKSELTSNYKAKGAKNAVGETEWPSGPVARELKEFGKPRVVVLSRYDKPIRIVPDSEVAQHIAETLKGTGISIPYNVVTPSLRAELEKAGVEVTENVKGNVKEKTSTQSVDNGDLFVIDASAKSDASPVSDDVMFSVGTHVVNNGKSLVGMHNINANKLRKVLKTGGLANPSAAVIDIDRQNHHGYGDISLIMPSSLVDSRTGINDGTYAGDAYTPTYPNTQYREGKDTEKRLDELTKGLPKELETAVQKRIGDYMDGNTHISGMEYLFLKEKGMEMPIAKNPRRYPNISASEISKKLGMEGVTDTGALYEAYERLQGDELLDFNLWLRKYGDENKINEYKKKVSNLNDKAKAYITSMNQEQFPFSRFDSEYYQIYTDERDSGKENVYQTLENAAMAVDEKNLRSEFEDWMQKQIDDLGYEEVIFAGYTPAGYRKYIPNTVENASRIMNKEDRVNSRGDEGVNATKAMLLDKFNTLSQIRQNKDLLENDKDKINEAYESVSNDWLQLGIDFRDYTLNDDKTAFGLDDNPYIATDNALSRLQEAMLHKDPIAYLNKEYRYSLPKGSEFALRLEDIKERIKNLPSKYFETKFRRPVYLNEFASAVVPQDLAQDLKDALSQNGLKLYEYDPQKEGDRREATLEATDDDAIRFSVVDDENLNNYNAGTLSTKEVVAKTLAEAAAKNKDDANKRLVAINAISKNLHDLALKLRQMSRGTDKLSKRAESNIRGAVSGIEKATADYDKATIDQIVRLSKILMDSKLFKDFSNYEVRRLLAVTRDATGSKDITKQAEKVVDIMLDHALKEAENIFDNQMKVRGSKVGTNGVEVQGKLDVAGQRMMKDLREAMKLDKDGLVARMAEVQDNLGSEDQTVADNAAIEMQALQIAQQYQETIAQSEIDEAELRRQVEVAKENGIKGEALKELKESVNEAIMKNKADRLDAYINLTKKLGGEIQDFMNKARAFREQQIQRVRDIQHNANSDLEGKSASEHSKASKFADRVNSSLVRFFMKPLATFNDMLQLFGSKSVNGRGYLFNRFMPQWQKALDDSTGNFRKDCDELGAKVSEVMGKKMRWSDLFSIERKMPTINVKFLDDGEMTDHKMSQGQALYIYMVNKMTDGKMKLRAMGITEEDVERITKEIDPRFIELADWVQDEYLPRKRNDFNAVHERMFGAPMAAIEDYFPLEINSRSRGQVEDISKQDMGDTKPSTTTGSIIKRKVNTIALDLTNADAFNVLLGHLQDMEHWAAYAEFNRDLNTLLSYKRFKNRVLNMETVRFGAGETLWKNFKDVCAIAADVYHPMVNRQSLDTAAVNISKGVTSAKIAFRAYTALKQLLSYPAYFGEANVWYLAKNTVRPARAFNWALDELPGFEERWRSRQAGDSRLKDTDVDWGFWKNKIVDTARRWGMTPNAFVDGLTVAMGARAIYETKYHQFKKDGFSDADAKKKALSEASVAYNETQQSSQNAYLSAMQLDRTVASVALTVFRNASMGYQRKFLRSIDNLKRKVTIGKKEMIDFMTKQGVREGLTEEQAKKAAERAWKRSWYQDAINTLIFGFVMQFAWNLGSYMVYLIFGDDDNEKEAMLKDAAMHAVAGPVEGLTGGSVISEVYNMARSGQKISNYQFNLLPIIGDIQTAVKHLEQDEVRGLNDIVNLVIQAGVGVNPQTITDVVAAIVDATNGDMETGKEAAMLMMRIAQVPQSQLDKLYIDELGLSAADTKKLSAEQLAKRYAAYKVHRDTPLTGWMYSEEGKDKAIDRYEKRFEKLIQERVAKMEEEDMEKGMESTDIEIKNLIGKEIANRMGGQDKAGSKPSSNWNENTKMAHETYQKLRNYRDVVEDVLLQNAQKKADEAYEQALKDWDMVKVIEYQKRANRIEDVRRNILEKKRGLGRKSGEKDAERMEKIRAFRKKKMQDLGIK